MAKGYPLFLLLVSSSLCVFALELDTILPHSPLLSDHALPPYHHHHHNHNHNRHRHHSHRHPLSPTPTHVYPPHHSSLHSSPPHPPHHHHHHHHHSHAPAKPPTHHHRRTSAPAKPFTHHIYTLADAPVHPPTQTIPGRFVAVEGYIYTKNCKHDGIDIISRLTPVNEAVVKLECNNTKKPLIQKANTNVNGQFFIQVHKSITTYEVDKCKVFLVSAPHGDKPSNFHGGIDGAILRPENRMVLRNRNLEIYKIPDLAFDPICPQ